MEFRELIALIEQYAPQVLAESGEVFFGSKNSLRSSNGVAIVGLNPGGSGLSSIRENLEYFDEATGMDAFSGYLDQCWHEPFFSRYESCPRCLESQRLNGVVHQDRHQKMVSRIAERVGFDLRSTIALNAIWMQTRSAVELRSFLKENALPDMATLFLKQFFPVIREVFSRCNIRFVLCLGNGRSESSFEFFRLAHGVAWESVACISDNYRDGRYFEVNWDGKPMVYFGIPHPSLHVLSEQGLSTAASIWSNLNHVG